MILKNNSLKCEVVNGQVVGLSSRGINILYKGSSIKRSGIPVLFPFANPLENNILDCSGGEIGQHGFARNSVWKLESQSNTEVMYSLAYSDLEEEYKKIYPFDFKLVQKITLLENSLLLNFEIINNDDKEMPVAIGLHPYFAIKHEEKSSFSFTNVEGFEPAKFNWENPEDGSFYPWLSNSMLETADYKLRIKATNGFFPYNVVWSQTKSDIDYDFVCLEPFSRPTNGINIDPMIIKPKTTKSFYYEINYLIPSI